MWRMDEWLGCVLQVVERTEVLAARMDHPNSLNARIKSFVLDVKSNYGIIPGVFIDETLTEPWSFELELNNAVIGMHDEFLALSKEAQSVGVNILSLKRWMYLVFGGMGSDYRPSWAALFEYFLWDRLVDGVKSAMERNQTINGFNTHVWYIAAAIEEKSPKKRAKDTADFRFPLGIIKTIQRETQADFNSVANIADQLGWRVACIYELLEKSLTGIRKLNLPEIWKLWVNNRPRS